MKLKALLQDVETKDVCTADTEIRSVTDNTARVRQGSAFVCIKGTGSDGHDYYKEALEKGAAAIISERPLECGNCVVVKDTRKAYALMCSNFYGRCHRNLRLIGVTGTNGKTTTSYIIKKIFEDCGYKTGLIGTISVVIGREKYPADLTTPNPADLHKYFMLMNNAGCEVCVMEVSSQALKQQRVYGIDFDCSVFTNLSPEHLDYHKSMGDYAKSKAVLFGMSRISVINNDDNFADFMKKSSAGKIVTYGIRKQSDYRAGNINLSSQGVSYTVTAGGKSFPVTFGSMGIFSVYNSLGAAAAAEALGINYKKAIHSVSGFGGIAGRMEKVGNKFGINIIIDYAHTPDSLENSLKTLRSVYKGKLITVFGCGGDRDKSKRNIMGKISVKYSDTVFVTSDNPRTESPKAIIEEITKNIDTDKVFKITDRTAAIKSAVFSAGAGDTVFIAGKGHEKYQIIGTQKIYYNEREIIKKILEEKERF